MHMTFQKPHLSKTIQYFSMKKFKAYGVLSPF